MATTKKSNTWFELGVFSDTRDQMEHISEDKSLLYIYSYVLLGRTEHQDLLSEL